MAKSKILLEFNKTSHAAHTESKRRNIYLEYVFEIRFDKDILFTFNSIVYCSYKPDCYYCHYFHYFCYCYYGPFCPFCYYYFYLDNLKSFSGHFYSHHYCHSGHFSHLFQQCLLCQYWLYCIRIRTRRGIYRQI